MLFFWSRSLMRLVINIHSLASQPPTNCNHRGWKFQGPKQISRRHSPGPGGQEQ